MTNSVLGVRNIQHTNGTDAMTIATDGGVTFSNPPAGSIIEVLTGICMGGSQTIQSGTYTFPNVTAIQSLSTTYADIDGSSFSYTPPAGTRRVKYELEAKLQALGYSGISHYKFFIDSTEVVDARRTMNFSYSSSNQGNLYQTFTWIIDCAAASADANAGSFTSWTSAKTMKWQGRNYDSSYQMRLHTNRWWDGAGATGTNNIAPPFLTITAYA